MVIYRRANRDLGPRFGREVEAPDWIETFNSEAVFINQRGDLVPNDEYLFANDSPAMAALFKDDEDLSFLAVPTSEVPRLSRLLDAADVGRLSHSITLEVSNADSGVGNEELTARVRRSVRYFARVLYAKRPEEFEQALKDGGLARLKNFEVEEVPEVELVVSLGEYSRETTTDMALSGEKVLYRAGARSVMDMLAAELSKFLGAFTDLADTFARILMESDVESIEDFLKVRGIGALPTDLLEALEIVGEQDADEETRDRDSGEATQEVDEAAWLEESGLAEVDSTSVSALGDVANDGDAPSSDAVPHARPDVLGSPTGQAKATAPLVESMGTPAVSAENLESPHSKPGLISDHALEPSNSSEGRPSVAGTAPTVVKTNFNGTPPAGTQQFPLEGAKPPVPQNEEGVPTGPVTPTQPLSGIFARGQAGGGTSQSQSSGKHSRGTQRRGQLQPPRTKAGRLLSYAASPNDSDKPNPDEDPAKAAAREATGRAAVEYFMTTQAGRWKSLVEMPHNNPGFDVQALTNDDEEEFIEVKGQSSAWTEEGVALTPTELMTAQQRGSRYWLCVVEYAQDDKRRQLHLVCNPYGLTQQFRFDVGWKSVAESVASAPSRPEKDMYIDVPGVGRGQIISVRAKGRFFNLHLILENGQQVNQLFNPAKMTLSEEPPWHG